MSTDPSATSSSYILASAPTSPPISPSPASDISSLPDTASSDSISDYTRHESDAEREWKESLQQLELLLTMVLVPYLGKYIGRKCAYWAWARFMEWKYPVDVVVTSPKVFRGAGAVEAAAAL